MKGMLVAISHGMLVKRGDKVILFYQYNQEVSGIQW
jgi:hypothetical protein